MRRLNEFDRWFINIMRAWGVTALRLALGILFLWFGALKLAGASPAAELVRGSYSFLPYPGFVILLGVWEMAIGLGLIFKKVLRITLALLWLQLLGTLAALLLAPSLFFIGANLLFLTLEGEFVIKNLVLIAAGIVIGGFEVRPFKKGK